MARLAIKGHKTSGRFVIALLKMMGGKDSVIPCIGTNDGFYYFIDNDGIIKSQCDDNKKKRGFKRYTYGEFVEDFPYKVGDRVHYFVYIEVTESSVEQTATVRGLKWNKDTVIYTLDNGDIRTAKDLRPIAEQPSTDKSKAPALEGQDYSEGRCGYIIPEGFEFDKVENGEIILKSKKKELPKTYKDCCEAMGIDHNLYLDLNHGDISGEYKPNVYTQNLVYLFNKLYMVLICRDAYWKLADDWSFKIGGDTQEVVYAISVFGSGIMKDFYYALNCNRILVFPTEEMRDAFYENFKDLIDECKELL